MSRLYTPSQRRAINVVSALVTLALVAVAGYFAFAPAASGLRLSADFSRTVGLYAGDDVRVLGVTVGHIDAITPEPSHVHVTMTLDKGIQVPADAEAVIVAPSLVTSRFVQLTPAYVSGAQLASGTTIPRQRTAVPIEFDEVKTELTRLSQALGPNATNPKGTLARTLKTTDANLTGSATQLRTMLGNLSQASETLADNRGNLFGTVRGLSTFITALARNDSSVRSFSRQLTNASDLLSDDSTSLGTALTQLDSAVSELTSFVANNRSAVKSSVSSLATLTKILADKQYQLAEALHVAPTGLSNFYNIIDPRYQAAVGTLAIGNFDSLAQLVCRQVVATGGFVNTCLSLLNPLLQQIGLGSLPLSAKQALARSAEPYSIAGGASNDGSGAAASPTAAKTLDVPTGTSTTGLISLLLPGGGS